MSTRLNFHTYSTRFNVRDDAKSKLVEELIASEATPFGEDDRVALAGLSNAAITNLVTTYLNVDVAEDDESTAPPEDELPAPSTQRRHARVYGNESLVNRRLAGLYGGAGSRGDVVLNAQRRMAENDAYEARFGSFGGRGVKVNANDPVANALPPSSASVMKANANARRDIKRMRSWR